MPWSTRASDRHPSNLPSLPATPATRSMRSTEWERTRSCAGWPPSRGKTRSASSPKGSREADCRWRILVDPLDGTRGLMYQKRSAWVLTGVAPNRGAATQLSDIVLAVQTEIPLVKQHLCDQLWAIRGK